MSSKGPKRKADIKVKPERVKKAQNLTSRGVNLASGLGPKRPPTNRG